jgi:SPRY domain-containing SOCS box protein 3
MNEKRDDLNRIGTIDNLQHGIRVADDWHWDELGKSECVSLSKDQRTACFFENPFTISRGTAAVRGNRPLGLGVSYFEILVREPLYGTAVMIGLGTDAVKLHYENFDYINLVGVDGNGWGLCHKGFLWHNGQHTAYCAPFFDKDIRIGLLFDSYERTIRYFMNGKDLGVAFRNVRSDAADRSLYPIISSTATDVELELVGAFKFIPTLQDLCFRKIRASFKSYSDLPLPRQLQAILVSNN